MEVSDYLLTTAEVAVAFVGFAAIVVAIRERGGLEPTDRTLVGWMIERGLAALSFALLPLLLLFLGVAQELIWRLGSAGIFVYILSVLARSLRLRRARSEVRTLLAASNFWLRFTANAVAGAVQLLAGLGVLTASMGWYLVGVSWLLVAAAMIFVTFMRRPT